VVNQGMEAVITGGTGKGQFTGFPYVVAGKSGTAERFSRRSNDYDNNKNTAYLATRHRAWFIAYTPTDAPRIAVAAMLEQGAWGVQDAGPIVRKIMEAWLASQGGAVPARNAPEQGLAVPASTSSVPEVPEDTPVATPADTPAQLPADHDSDSGQQDDGGHQ
jgi:penicillin-binding protein 2